MPCIHYANAIQSILYGAVNIACYSRYTFRQRMAIGIESEKAHSFVQHLYANPSLQQYTPLQREDQIAQFLNQNSSTLLPTLSSSQFFPGYSWDKILQMVFTLVRERTNELFSADIRELLSRRINFDFLRAYGISSVNYDQVQEQLLTVVNEMMRYPRARQSLSGSHVAILYSIFSRYVRTSFSLKRYIHFEFTKVQKLPLSADQLSDMLKVVLLLMPIVWVFVEQEESSMHITSGNVSDSALTKALDYLVQTVNLLPESILKSAVYGSVSFAENNQIDATSRAAAIFSARCRNYHPSIKIDRGAESADKSWFYIAKRNYKFYGFDAKMLEEFYGIASEEKW